MNDTRIILRINGGSDGILALRAAHSLIRDGHKHCAYAYENGAVIWAYRTKTAVVAREEIQPRLIPAQDARP